MFVGDAALKVPTSLKRRIQNLQDFSLSKKKTPLLQKGAAASPQDKHRQRLITSGGVPRTQERRIRGPFRVVHDGWEHAKLSPLSPRTEIFPGSQNSKPTGEALSEYDAQGAWF